MVHQARVTSEGGTDAYPLSSMQQGMLYHSLQGSRGVDVQQVIGELNEQLDPRCFERAWREVVERHPVLRTGVAWPECGEPRQVVGAIDTVSIPFHYIELNGETAARRAVDDYLESDRRKGFPSLAAPLIRVALFRGAAKRFWFVTTYHHLIIDARSMLLLFREVLDRHDARVAGLPLQLPPAPPYRNFIDWLQTRDLSASEAFWRRHLSGFADPTPLPGARSTGAGVADPGACGELMFRLPVETMKRLRSVARQYGVTVNTLVQGAWAIVLSRYSGESDVVFGTLRSGRRIPVEGVDAMMGLLVTAVPVRVHLESGLQISIWLRNLRDAWVAMRPHEHTPLTQVQQWSEVKPGRPLFETVLNYQDPSWDEALGALGGKWARRSFDIRSRPNYPLAIDVYGGLTLTTKCFYERDRYDAQSVARVLGHFRTVLKTLAAGSVDRVGGISLLSAEESTQVVVDWNRTHAEFPRDRCIHTYIEAHAAESPDRIAVSDAAVELTFANLNTRANRLAHRLIKRGVTRETPVAVCLPRSAEMLVAWLAVLKAGGAFVPLDPGYPADRLTFQIEDCGAPVLLVQPGGRSAVAATLPRVTVLEITAAAQALANEPGTNPAIDVRADNLAYIIYTSGSTGQPKGVEIEHRSLLNLATWHQRAYQLTRDDRSTQLASPAFDASVWETWPYLAAGASVHIADDETRLSPTLLWRWMAEKQITLSFLPTPLMEAAMGELWPARLALRALLTGGDTLKRRPPANFPFVLINHYGPTESTVVATCGRVAPDSAGGSPTIGRPIANTSTYVLDRNLRPVPVGVAGELFLGGESLARGYLRRPELNAERFIYLNITPGAAPVRVYRTGDRVRWTADGELEFLGRMDGQIKIRGCRIELGEVETNLQAHPAVRDCLVVARSDERGGVQLVAYALVNGDASSTSERDLIDHLRGRLPAYMVPSALVRLSSWPLTPNGKIDRRALPAPLMPEDTADRTDDLPRTVTEVLIAKIWNEVIGRPALARHENFFDLGGHSLLAAQVVARLNAVLPVSISVRSLFDHPTLGAFAREVDQRRANAASQPRIAPQRLKRRSARPELELAEPK